MGEPKHGTGPIVQAETAGKKAYCQCGLSDRMPYCDGAHSREGTDIAPIVVEITEDATKAICQCYQSKDKPWCDGTHSRITR